MTRQTFQLARLIVLTLLPLASVVAQEGTGGGRRAAEDVAATESLREMISKFPGRGAVGDPGIAPKSVAESLACFQVPDDLAIETVLAEPTVRQPLQISFDERGRMWVVQYIQYPFPAGLKIVKYDEHLRIVFDKVPEPPPHGPPGADRITIHEDTNGDGSYDHHKTFLAGLNIATACARGRGGVWVMNPPYLLFYPDRDGDDRPDGEPEVHLRGFGLEDTHAVANSLTWGPDGWLYGAQGSTCWATVDSAVTRGLHFKGQAVWRYHPETKVFEIFAEGGGNTFAVEFDAAGRLFSGHNGGDTRGFHYVQGGYYQKSWGKHGALTNPYAFGFFPQMKHGKAARFSHTLIRYEEAGLPEHYHGQLIAPVPLHQHVVLSEMAPLGSTFETRDLDELITTSDQWFRPVDVKAGPDGAVYLADWYDTRLTHVDPRDTWDRERGRIYRLRAKDAPAAAPVDLSRDSPTQLVERLTSPNKWTRQTALRLLYDARPASVVPRLRERLREEQGQTALEALWALNACEGLDEETLAVALAHASPHVRRWGVRLIGDRRTATPQQGERLRELAAAEPDVEVRSQLASSAKRLPGSQGLPIVWALCRRGDDADPHLPLLVWWAVEDKAVSDQARVVEQFASRDAWQTPLIAKTILPRLAERYASDPTPDNLQALATILDKAPGAAEQRSLVAGVLRAFQGRRLGPLPVELTAALLRATSAEPDSATSLELRLRAGDLAAEKQALPQIADRSRPLAERQKRLELLGQTASPAAADTIVALALSSEEPAEIRRAAFGALTRFDDRAIGERLVASLPGLPRDGGVQSAALEALASRAAWARQLAAAVEEQRLPAASVPAAIIERLRLHGDEHLSASAERIWGKMRASPKELTAQMAFVAEIVRSGEADAARGKSLFTQKCAACHRLHGEGKEIGPDLTGYERTNQEFLLLSVIDPSAFIREEYMAYRVETDGGLVLTGFIAERGATSLTLVSADRGRQVIPLAEIADGPTALPNSLMPERLLDDLTAQQIRDLFAYLRK